jgi:hypothetical protein
VVGQTPDQLMWVACLAATGMSVRDMRSYVANGALGPAAAGEQVELLSAPATRLAGDARTQGERLRSRRIRRAAGPHDHRAPRRRR